VLWILNDDADADADDDDDDDDGDNRIAFIAAKQFNFSLTFHTRSSSVI